MQVTEATKAMAQKIVDYFLIYPERHEQADFVGKSAVLNEKTVCNTTMCIAGSAVFLGDGIKGLNDCILGVREFDERGAELLGLNDCEATALFYTMENDMAIDAVHAIAQGDEKKFWNALRG